MKLVMVTFLLLVIAMTMLKMTRQVVMAIIIMMLLLVQVAISIRTLNGYALRICLCLLFLRSTIGFLSAQGYT